MNISPILSGLPDDLENRTYEEQQTFLKLQELGIDYSYVNHEPAATLELCSEIDKVLDTHICKNLFLCNRQRTAFYLLLIEGNKIFKTKFLSSQIQSSRLSFASAEDMRDLLRVSPGSASVFSLLFDGDRKVQLLIDEPLLSYKCLGFHPCKNTSSIKISVDALLHCFLPYTGHSPIIVSLPEVMDASE